MTINRLYHSCSSVAPIETNLRVRLDHIGLFGSGLALSILEASLRKELDLPFVETVLAIWGVGEFLGRRLRLETARPTGLYMLAGAAAMLGAWIVIADAVNAQQWSTTLRNLLKYEILFLVLAWLAHTPSKDRIAPFLIGSVLGIATLGATVLLANPEAPYLAKYQTPYVGVVLLSAWASARPFNGGWRWLLPVAAGAVALLALHASARWALLSGLLVCVVMLAPRLARVTFRIVLVVMAATPLIPLLLLDTETAMQLIAENDLNSAADVERVTLYAFAHGTIVSNSLFGIGFEGFLNGFEAQFGHMLKMTSAVQGPHNQYAAIGSLFGVPALILYATTVWASMNLLHAPTRRPTRLALAAAAMFSFMFLANEISDDARLALYLVALILASGRSSARPLLVSLFLPDRVKIRSALPLSPRSPLSAIGNDR